MRATYYSDRFVGRKTSNGEIFSQTKYTAAHHSLRMGTLLLVTNEDNGRQVIVRVNDRCPKRNILDLSRIAAKQISIGSHLVKVQILPSRFYDYWERQEQYLDILAGGGFLHFVHSQHLDLLSDNPVADASQGNKPAADTKKSNDKDDASQDRPLFNVVLGDFGSHASAEKKASTLPVFYSDYITYRSHGNVVTLILELSTGQAEADSTVEELKPLFPTAKTEKK